MKAMWKLFTDDVRRITGNVVSIIIVIGLVAIPSLFAWFNIAASWDPFGSMGNLKVAVANVDEGYQSDLIPVKVTIGAEVVDTLRANDQLDWTFTTKQDAIEGTRSGSYYAAIVIPKNFSARMMTFFTDDAHQATITYYRNEKKNALAPNLTGAGADEVAAQINEMFAETIASTALDIASALADQLNRPQSQEALTRFDENIGDFATRLTATADTLGDYRALTDSAATLLDTAKALLDQTSSAVDAAGTQLSDARAGVDDVASALDSSVDTATNALQTSKDAFASCGDDVDALFDDASHNAAAVSDALRKQADIIATQASEYRKLHDVLANLTAAGNDASITAVANALQRAADQTDALADKLTAAADSVDAESDTVASDRQSIKEQFNQAKDAVSGALDSFNTAIGPHVEQLTASVKDASSVLSQNKRQLDDTVTSLDKTASSSNDTIDDIRAVLDASAASLRDAGEALSTFHTSLNAALTSGDVEALREVIGTDASSLASELAAPVALDRKAVFPVDTFGSAMTPYYTFIPLWTASLLIALAISATVSREQRERLGAMKPYQMFLGRFGIVALISLLQSTTSCAGSLLFLRVQAVHPLLFMLSGWIGGLVFAFFVYTMVVSFGNVGKAIGMLMLVFQVSGSAGSYPLQVLPEFMQRISPFLPITHAIRAMRAAIAGMYGNDYWVELGMLLLFVPPLLLLGLLLRKPLVGLNRRINAQLERTKLIG